MEQPHAQDRHPKTEAIEKDAQDPHFLANLNRLGPVRVEHHMQVRLKPDATTLFKSRQDSASESRLSRNHLHSTSLCNLLDEHKSAASQSDLERLAGRYGIDVLKLENLARFVSSPSVQGGGGVKRVTEEGEESIAIRAVWIEPSIPHLR